MKYVFLNLKRFDIPPAYGGVNRIAPLPEWGSSIVRGIQPGLQKYKGTAEFTVFLPEAHLLSAAAALEPESPLRLGCQSVYRENTSINGNFGAFTSCRPAAAAAALGCGWTLIGHCEERSEKAGVLATANVCDPAAIDALLHQEVKAAAAQGLRVLYCVGEGPGERAAWEDTLAKQLTRGLCGIDPSGVCVAYEPVWAIGPGKEPPGRDAIQRIARFIKERTGGLPLVYGGGLREENAAMLASIPEIDGGLIALTRFSGEIGFYPEEYLRIVDAYMGGAAV